MSADNGADNGPHNDDKQPQGGHEPHHQTQAERDEEIAAIREHARHQRPGIERPRELPPARPRTALLGAGVVLLLLLAAGALTLLERARESRVLARETEESAVPTVAVVHPTEEKPDVEVVLPGSLQAFQQSPIYARTNGYLLRWTHDIGSQVKKGELLAEIETPEVDQELDQARAALRQTQAQNELARITTQRWEKLRTTDAVSAQEADQQASAYQQSQANVAAGDANVRRLEELESFKHVYAPFGGVLTQRNVDPGALINAGAGGKEMFDMAEVDTLRVFTSVPQAYAPYIRTGGNAYITLQEMPGVRFAAAVARTAEAIDPATRTLLTEVDVPNRDGRLLPGSFGEVHFAVGANVKKLTVRVSAMLFRAEGPQVAVVGQGNKVELRHIAIGRDYGITLEVVGGLSPSDLVIVNPPDSIETGEQVRIAQPPPAPQGSTPQGSTPQAGAATQGGGQTGGQKKSGQKGGGA